VCVCVCVCVCVFATLKSTKIGSVWEQSMDKNI